MTDSIHERRSAFGQRSTRLLLAAITAFLGFQPEILAQASGASAARGGERAPSKAGAPVDFTGYWVSVVTTLDWRLRMVMPAKGDYFGLRMTPAAVKIANAWDPAADEASGNQCRSYGAAGIMRIPGRLHITRPDENTLRMEIDAGTQTRLFHFGDGTSPAGEATWQGNSVAKWDSSGTGGLKVTTKHMRAGYLRKNGVPYSENATLTEYYDVVRERSGDQRMILTSSVEDPVYLQEPYTFSYQFKKEADASKWDPTPCSSKW